MGRNEGARPLPHPRARPRTGGQQEGRGDDHHKGSEQHVHPGLREEAGREEAGLLGPASTGGRHRTAAGGRHAPTPTPPTHPTLRNMKKSRRSAESRARGGMNCGWGGWGREGGKRPGKPCCLAGCDPPAPPLTPSSQGSAPRRRTSQAARCPATAPRRCPAGAGWPSRRPPPARRLQRAVWGVG